MHVEPIGIFHCSEAYPYDAARQGSVSNDNIGSIALHSGHNFEQALSDIEGFSHIWLLFQFHKNDHWKPMVQPPRGDRKVGVFASRAPYRPNAIGMSCVRLGQIRGRQIEVFGHDILDGTPILDIKPYLPYADSIPDASSGWLEEHTDDAWDVLLAQNIREQLGWLKAREVDCFESFLLQQLAHEPTNQDKKRVQSVEPGLWEIAYRTWRARFRVDIESHRVSITAIYSGYTEADLNNGTDPYEDKAIHRDFGCIFKATRV